MEEKEYQYKMCWMEWKKRNTSIKCAGCNGRREYQYKMCLMEWKKGILV